MNKKYDVIIIGSGLGGLQCAYILAKHGYKVAIFEKESQHGGCLQIFRRKGYTFDTGMHYIGALGEGEVMHTVFSYFDLFKDVKIKQLDADGFDLVTFGGKTFPYAMGYDNFAETLSYYFPTEREAIFRYIRTIQEIAYSSPMYNLKEINQPTYIESEYIKRSVGEFIASFTDNKELQQVLAGTNPLYAGVPDKTPVYVHALIMHSYIRSSYRIVGGSHTIVDSLIQSIKSMGGEVFANQEIVKIHCDDERATFIENSKGELFEATSFISNIHPAKTMQLINSHLIRNAYRHRMESMENTVSNFSLYIAFKPNTVKYMNHNIFHYDSNSVWNCQQYTDEEWPKNYLFMHHSRHQDEVYAETAQVITYMNYDDVKAWENTSVGHRGADYLAFKEQKAQRILDKLEVKFPGFRETVAFYETSSPLTYRDYTGTKNGSLYGVLRDYSCPAQTLVQQRTKIPNLFLTGQNINSHGFLGVSIGAIITAAEFLGINTIVKEINIKK